jgi:hypothetical protein
VNTLGKDSWQNLFESACGSQEVSRRLYEVRRGDTPLLYLPADGRNAAHGLALYPAQSPRARVARSALALALRLGLFPALKPIDVQIAERDGFAMFLREVAGTPSVPTFAVLAGNPRAPGRRFIFLLMNSSGEPHAVVKAAVTESARALTAHEEEFLRAAPAHAGGLPVIKRGFDSDRVRAFALEFIAGDSPRNVEPRVLRDLLKSWLTTDKRVQVSDLAAWQRLSAALKDLPFTLSRLAAAKFHPALMHGDLAPWNVKVCSGKWTVLDWERADRMGLPGWDWFHFELQPALLVRHESAAQLLARCEKLLKSSEFLDYATTAGIGSHGCGLLLAYLANCLRVFNQTEGREQLLELEQVATRAWCGSA